MWLFPSKGLLESCKGAHNKYQVDLEQRRQIVLKEQAALKAAQEADTAKADALETKTMKEEVQRARKHIDWDCYC